MTLSRQEPSFTTPCIVADRSTFPRNPIHQNVCQRFSRKIQTVKQVKRRGSGFSTIQMGFAGFLSPNSRNSDIRDSLPSPDTQCACGNDAPYGKCCRKFHVAERPPQLAEELLRSRYSAYAYRLPSYIMKTTHRSIAELDRRKWKREIMNFCREYQFIGGVDIIEQQMTGPSTTRILFRANLMQGNAEISFLEMATFTRSRNIWLYKSGKLVDVNDQEV